MHQFKTHLEPFGRAFVSCKSNSKIKKTAAGLIGAAKEMPIDIDVKNGFAYTCFNQATGMRFHSSAYCNFDALDSLVENGHEDAADLKYIRDNMQPYMRHLNPNYTAYTKEQLAHWDEGHLWGGGGWMGHAVPDHADIAKFGTEYYREKVEKYRAVNPGKDDFYDSILMTMDALDILGGRIREVAETMLADAEDSDEIRKLTAIRDTFTVAPQKPCHDFVQASIVFVWIFSFDGIDSPGYFDQYMYDFWKVTEPAIRREYLEAVWQFFHNTRSWNLCIGGSDENWNDLSNDLTYEILDVTAKYKYQTPNLTMRCHRNTPEKLLRAAYKAIATGCGMPTLYNDEVVCPALESLGIPPCDSHYYVMNGCNQIDIQGKSHMGLEDGEVLIAKAVEFVLFNGLSSKTGKDLGLHTGDPTEFESFDEFYDAFFRQLDYMTDLAAEMSNNSQRLYAKEAPNPLRSALIDGCIEKGRDYKDGGPLYGNGQILAEGVADAIDSLAAVKKYVYEDKKYTMAELVDALSKDFEGYDEMYLTLKNSELKFGNDIDYVDSIGAEVVDHFNNRLLGIETARGGHFSGGCSPFSRAPSYGKVLGALPNGKKRDEYLIADSIGATPGCDTHGPTALLNSCLKFNHTLAGSGFILNIKFDKAIFNSEAGEETFLAVYRSYFGRLGQQLSVTVVSAEELIDAQKHPENHRDLIVRVGGYSDYFTNLTRELQENVIARTNYQTV